MMRLSPPGAVLMYPMLRTASPENQRKNSAAYVASARASPYALPISATISSASSSARSVMISNARRRISDRSRGDMAAKAGPASAAASTAAIASSAEPLGTWAIGSPVDGSNTSISEPSEASRHSTTDVQVGGSCVLEFVEECHEGKGRSIGGRTTPIPAFRCKGLPGRSVADRHHDPSSARSWPGARPCRARV